MNEPVGKSSTHCVQWSILCLKIGRIGSPKVSACLNNSVIESTGKATYYILYWVGKRLPWYLFSRQLKPVYNINNYAEQQEYVFANIHCTVLVRSIGPPGWGSNIDCEIGMILLRMNHFSKSIGPCLDVTTSLSFAPLPQTTISVCLVPRWRVETLLDPVQFLVHYCSITSC